MKRTTKSTITAWRKGILRTAPGLEAAEQLFDAVQDVLFCVKDLQRRYVAANTAFLKAAHVNNRMDLLGRTAQQVFPAVLAAGYEQQDADVLQRGQIIEDRLEMITHPDGGIGWFISQKVPVRDHTGSIIALAGISRDLAKRADQVSLDPLARAINRIHRDCDQSLRIEELAQGSGLSWSQFCRRVQTLTGLSPRQLLTKARVEKAAQLLRTSKLSLNQIALQTGFYDQAVFTRQFRTLTGLTPGEYRRALA
jgi:AraC-like DNA-binding protein